MSKMTNHCADTRTSKKEKELEIGVEREEMGSETRAKDGESWSVDDDRPRSEDASFFCAAVMRAVDRR